MIEILPDRCRRSISQQAHVTPPATAPWKETSPYDNRVVVRFCRQCRSLVACHARLWRLRKSGMRLVPSSQRRLSI